MTLYMYVFCISKYKIYSGKLPVVRYKRQIRQMSESYYYFKVALFLKSCKADLSDVPSFYFGSK